jgi:hypothetical protein
MRLPDDQVARFYTIWKPLLFFVNEQRQLVPSLLGANDRTTLPAQDVFKIREVLWSDDSLREAFLAQNPAKLSEADLGIVRSWQYRVAGNFYIVRHLKKYSIFLAEKGSAVYGVLGLISPIEEVTPFTPCYVKAVLLPFEGQIIYDSLLVPYNITFGSGYRRSFEQTYKDAKERGAIITSLLPPGQSVSEEEQREEARATDARVLEAFRKHLYKSGLGPKVTERDVATVSAFAELFLDNMPKPRSLRTFGKNEVTRYLSWLHADTTRTESQRRQVITGLKRFIKFLRDTERMNYDAAEDILETLK